MLGLERRAPGLNDLLRFAGLELPQGAAPNVIDEAMKLEPTLLNRVEHDAVLFQRAHTLQHVHLDQLQSGFLGGQRLEELEVLLAQPAQREEPGVDQAELLVGEGGLDATARGVAAQHDVLDLEVGDGVLDDGGGVEVTGVHDVGDVAVHEDVAGLQAQDGGLGAARVGAADPEDLRVLARRQLREEIGVFLRSPGGPVLVLGQAGLVAV